jgi:hypothetical protein
VSLGVLLAMAAPMANTHTPRLFGRLQVLLCKLIDVLDDSTAYEVGPGAPYAGFAMLAIHLPPPTCTAIHMSAVHALLTSCPSTRRVQP